MAGALVKDGVKILKPDGAVVCEIWLVAAAPAGDGGAECVPGTAARGAAGCGAVSGAVCRPTGPDHQAGRLYDALQLLPDEWRSSGRGAAAGFRHSITGGHGYGRVGEACLYDALMDMSRKASGTPHPLVLSIWKDDPPSPAGVEAVGDHDQVLHTKMGGIAVSIIVVGKAEG